MIRLRILILIPFLIINCTSQYGNPSNTVWLNTGTNGFYATSYSPKDKAGEACTTNYFGIIAIGDGSIEKASSKAGITKISSVSHETKVNYLVVQDICTVVRGL